ncbi:hypothetical protein Leryth_026655 [Lithospermum erythrorhizon]|nr:hypothetical protein Leryth_026655 [Lithospermum erythrorhizon]
MEVLCLHPSTLNAFATPQNNQRFNLLGSSNGFHSSKQSTYRLKQQNAGRFCIRAEAVEEEYEIKQVKDMAAARKRWDSMVFQHN